LWRVSRGLSALPHEPASKNRLAGKTKTESKPKQERPMQMKQSLTNTNNQHSSTACRERHAALKLPVHSTVAALLGLIAVLFPIGQSVQAQQASSKSFVAPMVFQAAGPDAASIQGTVDAYRAALGGMLNGNNPGPLTSGRREINWDGGNPAIMATTDPVTPFNVFLNTRGSQFTTPGKGLSQATPSGLATLFNNPTYANIFTAFSPSRLFTPVGSDVTEGLFFIPGSNGGMPATVSGFGAVFTDVDQPDGSQGGKHPGRDASTLIEYFDKNGREIFSANIPSSPGDGSLSFFGIVFNDARIARVQITTDERPGRNDDEKHDIVMMDDFIYGEPQPVH
jgi:hypothetical protein